MNKNTVLSASYTILIASFISHAYAAITPYQQVADLQKALTQGERKIYQPLVLNQRKNDATLGQKVFCWARAAYNAEQLYEAVQKIDNWSSFDPSQFSSLESLQNETTFNQWILEMKLISGKEALANAQNAFFVYQHILQKTTSAFRWDNPTDIAIIDIAAQTLGKDLDYSACADILQQFVNNPDKEVFINLQPEIARYLDNNHILSFQQTGTPKLILLLYSGTDDQTHRPFTHWIGIVMTPAGMVVTESYGKNESEPLSTRDQTKKTIILALYDLMVGKPSSHKPTKTAATWKQKVQELIKQTYREYKAENHLQAQITFKLAYEALQNEGGKNHEFIEQYFTQNFPDYFKVENDFDSSYDFFTTYLKKRLNAIAMDQPSLIGHKKEATAVDNLATLQGILEKLKKGIVTLKEKLQSTLQALGTLKQKLSELRGATK